MLYYPRLYSSACLLLLKVNCYFTLVNRVFFTAIAANKGLTLMFIDNRETLLCPSTCPCPNNCEYQRKKDPSKYKMTALTRYALNTSF